MNNIANYVEIKRIERMKIDRSNSSFRWFQHLRLHLFIVVSLLILLNSKAFLRIQAEKNNRFVFFFLLLDSLVHFRSFPRWLPVKKKKRKRKLYFFFDLSEHVRKLLCFGLHLKENSLTIKVDEKEREFEKIERGMIISSVNVRNDRLSSRLISIHFLPHCRIPLWEWLDSFQDRLLLLLVLLPELDTLSDLLIGFLVGSKRRSNTCLIVLCLRLNGLVYIFFEISLLRSRFWIRDNITMKTWSFLFFLRKSSELLTLITFRQIKRFGISITEH